MTENAWSGPADGDATIRPFGPTDEAATAEVWHRAGRAADPYLPTWQALDLDAARMVFRDVIMRDCRLWVGTRDGVVVAFLGMDGSYLDRLYVDPPQWRCGWGTRFVTFAKAVSPDGIELHTHQENHAARALYERQGFIAVEFGITPPPESAPDVKYRWRPQPS